MRGPVRLWIALALAGCSGKSHDDSGSGGSTCPTDNGTGCADEDARVDLYTPVFSSSTSVTNPLFPISSLASVVFAGWVDGAPFRTETTLLPYTVSVGWSGGTVEALVSQYTAFSDGRIEEVAIDLYAQDDLGAVWYLGEDVSDYDEEGRIYTHEGTWHVGVDGAPITMIMPAFPRPGDVFLAENIAPLAWEEVTVVETDAAVDGPSGPVAGAMIGSELHMDGTRQEKIFAPGYGEFSTGSLAGEDLEALVLAHPIDDLGSDPPADLLALGSTTADLFDAALGGDWATAGSGLSDFDAAWSAFGAGQVPPGIRAEIDRVRPLLGDAIAARNGPEAATRAIEVGRLAWDLRLRHVSRVEVDTARLDLWMAQVLADAAAGAAGPVRGDSASAGFVWDRVSAEADPALAAVVEVALGQLADAADADDLPGAAAAAESARAALGAAGWR